MAKLGKIKLRQAEDCKNYSTVLALQLESSPKLILWCDWW